MVEYYRIRIIFDDSRIAVVDKSFSQVVELIKGIDPEGRKAFWNKRETKLDGCSVKLVREGV